MIIQQGLRKKSLSSQKFPIVTPVQAFVQTNSEPQNSIEEGPEIEKGLNEYDKFEKADKEGQFFPKNGSPPSDVFECI